MRKTRPGSREETGPHAVHKGGAEMSGGTEGRRDEGAEEGR